MLNKILINWKSSSAGILLILGAVISIVYSISDNGRIEQAEMMAQITALLGGIGLLLSRDVGVSTERENGHPELEDAGERTDSNK